MENKASNTMSQEEKDFLEICIPLWERWLEDLGEEEISIQHMKSAFSQYSGMPEGSPLTMMFIGFCGGMEAGIDLAGKIDQMAETGETA